MMESVSRYKRHRLKLLNRIAERALTRGRKLTGSEKIVNLEAGLGLPPGHFQRMLEMREDE